MKLSLKQAIISAVVVLAGVSLFMPNASVFAQAEPVQLQAPTQQQAPQPTPAPQQTQPSPSPQPAQSSTTPSTTSTSQPTNLDNARCEAGSLGWVLCPVIKLGQEFIANMEDFIVDQLETGPLQTTGRYENLYKAWSGFRDLANVFFIGIFLVIIFAQALNIKMDSYSIKMMLPRLIVAAIAIQFSYFIMQIGFDIANVLGSGIADIFNTVVRVGPQGGADTDVAYAFTALTLVGVGGALAAGAALVTGLVVPALLLILAGALALLGVLVTVWLRVLILQFLVLLAPLAMVAWVMPNTQKWFATWRDNTIKLLLMYPIIVFIISAGALATHVTAITAETGAFAKILAACIPILVFFMIPAAIKASGSLMAFTSGLVMSRMSGYAKGVRGSQLMKDSRQDLKERAYRQYADNDPKTVNGFGKKNRARLQRGTGRIVSGNAFSFQHFGDAGKRKMAAGVASARHALESDYKTLFEDSAFSNPTLMRIAQAGLVDHVKEFTAEDTYGTKHKFKMNHHLAEAAVSRMIQQQGMVELSELLDGEKGYHDPATGKFVKDGAGIERNHARGLFDHKTNQWKSKEIQQTMLRAMGSNAGTVLNKITHAVHLQADKAYGDISGQSLAALGAGSGITASIEAVKWNRVTALNAMVQVINSNGLAGSIQSDVAKSMKRELIKAHEEGKFAGVTLEARGKRYANVKEFLEDFVTDGGQVTAVQGDIKRDGYESILPQITTEQAALQAEIDRAREEFAKRNGTPDLPHH